mmetsp:Transcript_32014/g.95634  ORF Transcript_32014/g.95634 Transcript_32014/m.95634 type:complete len:279 (+) Transcript_32014:106-942(+)
MRRRCSTGCPRRARCPRAAETRALRRRCAARRCSWVTRTTPPRHVCCMRSRWCSGWRTGSCMATSSHLAAFSTCCAHCMRRHACARRRSTCWETLRRSRRCCSTCIRCTRRSQPCTLRQRCSASARTAARRGCAGTASGRTGTASRRTGTSSGSTVMASGRRTACAGTDPGCRPSVSEDAVKRTALAVVAAAVAVTSGTRHRAGRRRLGLSQRPQTRSATASWMCFVKLVHMLRHTSRLAHRCMLRRWSGSLQPLFDRAAAAASGSNSACAGTATPPL